MAWEYRRPVLDLAGTLAAQISSSDTQITSQAFAGLPTDLNGSLYSPIAIIDDAGIEIVWASGHSSSSQSLTVSRGKEGTSQRTFAAGAIVCAAVTPRDTQIVVATRAALPSDAHYGCKAVIIGEEGQVVERTIAGWQDSAPNEADTGRKHHWQQLGVTSPNTSTLQTVAGLSAASNHTGDIASLSGGVCTLGKAGRWDLSWQQFSASSSDGMVYMFMSWPGGAFPLGTGKGQASHRNGGSGTISNLITAVEWGGYVTAAQALQPITLQTFQLRADGAALSGCQFDFAAEYGGN